jgi:hypothetical protein
VPTEFGLEQNYPNPFNPETVISYRLPVACRVSLKVYDLLGREIAVLVDKFQEAGTYNSRLSILNLPAGRQGYKLTSGIYFYRLSAGVYSFTKKMILVK